MGEGTDSGQDPRRRPPSSLQQVSKSYIQVYYLYVIRNVFTVCNCRKGRLNEGRWCRCCRSTAHASVVSGWHKAHLTVRIAAV
jgi:hypothetical protein